MLKTKENNGITLVALVVTIIILLILAGVTISMVLGQEGLFNKAQTASIQTQLQNLKEKAELVKLELRTEELTGGEKVTQESLRAKIVEELLKERTDVESEENSGKIAVGEYEIEISESLSIGVDYTGQAVLPQEPTPPQEPEEPSAPEKASDLKAGDYVNYVDKNGKTILCRVLYDEEYNTTNNTNYGIQIISNDNAKSGSSYVQIEFGNGTGSTDPSTNSTHFTTAKNSYNNAIKTLNDKALEFLNTDLSPEGGARSVGSVPDNPYSESEERNFTESFMSSYTGFKAQDLNYKIDNDRMTELGIKTTSGGDYWFASRYIYTGSNSYAFWVRRTDPTLHYNCKMGASENATSVSYTLGFRPVFTLDPNLKVQGEGTSNSPYTLSK